MLISLDNYHLFVLATIGLKNASNNYAMPVCRSTYKEGLGKS